jgi:hypothetical protein
MSQITDNLDVSNFTRLAALKRSASSAGRLRGKKSGG